MNKLPEELKTKWVEALRSGKFKQGVGRLKRDNAHCCLGVLCEITNARSLSNIIIKGVNPLIIPLVLQGSDSTVVETLTQMNDGSESDSIPPTPFTKIADYIEQNL